MFEKRDERGSAVMASRAQVVEYLVEVLVDQPVAFAADLVKGGVRYRARLVDAVRQRDGLVGIAMPDMHRTLDLAEVEAPGPRF
jgi:hypothetical protein